LHPLVGEGEQRITCKEKEEGVQLWCKISTLASQARGTWQEKVWEAEASSCFRFVILVVGEPLPPFPVA
jgi:hypothetical protein